MGAIYLIGASEHGPLKIGSSNTPEKRLSSLQIGNPVRLHVLRVWQHLRAGRIETASHKLLRPLRLQGEWFSVGVEAASVVIEQVIAAHQETAPRAPAPPSVGTTLPDRTEIECAQRKRLVQIEAIEEALGRTLTRKEIIRRELDGEFGEMWREARIAQGPI